MELEQPGELQPGPGVPVQKKKEEKYCSEKARELLLQKCGIEAGKYSWACRYKIMDASTVKPLLAHSGPSEKRPTSL